MVFIWALFIAEHFDDHALLKAVPTLVDEDGAVTVTYLSLILQVFRRNITHDIFTEGVTSCDRSGQDRTGCCSIVRWFRVK